MELQREAEAQLRRISQPSGRNTNKRLGNLTPGVAQQIRRPSPLLSVKDIELLRVSVCAGI
jgi:hypothetical protein